MDNSLLHPILHCKVVAVAVVVVPLDPLVLMVHLVVVTVVTHIMMDKTHKVVLTDTVVMVELTPEAVAVEMEESIMMAVMVVLVSLSSHMIHKYAQICSIL